MTKFIKKFGVRLTNSKRVLMISSKIFSGKSSTLLLFYQRLFYRKNSNTFLFSSLSLTVRVASADCIKTLKSKEFLLQVVFENNLKHF